MKTRDCIKSAGVARRFVVVENTMVQGDPASRATLDEHRAYLADWCRTTRDPFTLPAPPSPTAAGTPRS